MKVDVIVVGARCAGAATALLLARAGARVLVVDRGRPGSDTVSTHALMRGGVLQLHRWGLLPAIIDAGTPPVRSTTFSYEHEEVTVAVEPKHGVEALYAPRRMLLDGILSAAAAQAGAEVTYGVHVEDIITDASGRVRGITAAAGGARHRIEADLVVGADGLHSTIARRVGAAPVVEGRHATATLYTYWQGLPVDGFHWIFRPGGGAGAIPTNDATCVFVGIAAARFHAEVHGDPASAYRRLLGQVSPGLAAGLDTAIQLEPVHGFGGHPGFIKRSTGPGWALVGDAGYFKDPLTAHGITDALRDAELLARAAIEGTAAAFAGYEAVRLDLSKRLFEVTDDVASLAYNDVALQSLHREFSREMSREARALAALEPLPGLPRLADLLQAI